MIEESLRTQLFTCSQLLLEGSMIVGLKLQKLSDAVPHYHHEAYWSLSCLVTWESERDNLSDWLGSYWGSILLQLASQLIWSIFDPFTLRSQNSQDGQWRKFMCQIQQTWTTDKLCADLSSCHSIEISWKCWCHQAPCLNHRWDQIQEKNLQASTDCS